jgi:AhpD family alkylhydroperoxidase
MQASVEEDERMAIQDFVELPAGEWMLFDAPRIPPANPSTLGRVARGVLWLVRRQTKEVADFNVFLVLARLGRLFPAHAVFLSRLLGKTRLSAAEKELIVLRVAWRLGCAYEYVHHHHSARQLGVPDVLIQAATADDLTPFDDRSAALLRATDELLSEHKLTDAGWTAVRAEATPDEVLELCMFVGHYVMVAGIINTAGIQPESHFAVRVQN